MLTTAVRCFSSSRALAGAVFVFASSGCLGQRTVVYEYTDVVSHNGALYVIRAETEFVDSQPFGRRSTIVRCVEEADATLECADAVALPSGASEAINPDRHRETTSAGQGLARSAEEIEALEQLCWRDDASACFEFGVRLESGDGIARDTERACRLFDSACAGGVQDACARVASCAGSL